MSEHHHSRRLLYIVVGILFLLSAVVFYVKLRYLNFSLDDRNSSFYQVDADLSFTPEPGKTVRIVLALPDVTPGFCYGLGSADGEFRILGQGIDRRAELELPPSQEEGRRRVIQYRFRIVRCEPESQPAVPPRVMPETMVADSVRIAGDALWKQADPESRLSPPARIPALLRLLGAATPPERQKLSIRGGVEGSVAGAVEILNRHGIPARPLAGIYLDEKHSQQPPSLFLEAYYGGAWHVFRPNTGEEGLPPDFLILQKGERALFEVSGATGSSVRFAVTRVPVGAERLNRIRASILGERLLPDLTLFSLPAAEQNMFKHLALLPLAILLIVLTRNIIGIQTMGTFMPVLIAMAFLEMKLLPGLINFTLILTVGLAIRFWLSRLNLLMVPRISAVVVVVILLMQLISVAANVLRLPDFMAVTFFPLIIIAWTIERASTIWEEDGPVNTLKQLGASLVAGALCYLVLSNSYLQYLLYTFAELNLVLLGIILLLGTYTGYRLTELVRFQALAVKR